MNLKFHGLYVLDDNHRPVMTYDTLEWARMLESTERFVGDDYLFDGKVRVSTCFVGFDGHQARRRVPGLLAPMFETLVTAPDFTRIYAKYTTWEEAEVGHADCVLAMKVVGCD